MESQFKGHFTALLTVIIWASTFISTKILLTDFLPIEILYIRFIIGLIALFIAFPRPLPFKNWKQEGYFLFSGIFGVFLYYFLENVALTYTQAMNVGIIGSVSPFITALLSQFVLRKTKMDRSYIFGFLFAITGICLISLTRTVNVNLIGDGLAFFATFFWAVYSLLINRISGFGYSTIATTQRIFFYGLLAMTPVFFTSVREFDLGRVIVPANFGNLFFLGIGASAVCFVTWNYSVKVIGAVQATIYIYSIPVLTTAASVIVLHEKLTGKAIIGIILTLFGLLLSEWTTIKQYLRLQKE
ncbi:putative transporter YbhF [Enterococcus florum]|uniref:Putative transporter YbhF n=1 Tax=Enterococcus florum TaxID=2480627 RepID=A0A4P5PD67_9ENTE|nr:DMT family transporter [Enterococcus florum]GCF94514.1 putative transporter YbhF [Enterococcus florum]